MIHTSPSDKAKTVSRRQIYSWASGGLAEQLLLATVANLFMPIFNTGFGIDAFWIGLAATIPRLLDAVTDPFIGHLSDNTRSRWGRRRPYLFVSCVVLVTLSIAIWWLPKSWPNLAQFTWLLGFSVVFWIAWGCYTIPRTALGYELTDDYHERTRVQTVNLFFVIICGLFMHWIYWFCLRPFFHGEINGIRIVSAGLGAVILVAGLMPAVFCRERFRPEPKAKPPGLRVAFGQALRNRPFRHLVLLRVVHALGFSIHGGFLFYVTVYYACHGDKDLGTKISGLGGTVWTLVAILLIPFTPKISRHFGKHTGLMLGYGGLLLLALLLPILITPANPYLQVLACVLNGPATTCAALFVASFMSDVCDVDELNHGFRREGLFSAVDNMISKLQGALIVLVTGALLTFSGFDPHQTQQAPEVLSRLRWLCFGPNILCMTVAFILAWRFPLNHTIMASVRRQLDERRALAETAK